MRLLSSKSILDSVEEMLSKASMHIHSFNDFQNTEIELRVGKIIGPARSPKFTPGISKPSFEKIQKVLRHTKAFKSNPCITSVVKIFADGVRVIEDENKNTLIQLKQKLHNCDFRSLHAFALRMSVSVEETRQSLDVTKTHLMERLKNRETFVYKMWQVDLTTVIQRRNVIEKDDDRSVLYELEVELHQGYFNEANYSQIYDFRYRKYFSLCVLHLICDIFDMINSKPS